MQISGVNAMRIVIGPKQWTWQQQRGLRLFASPIRNLTAELVFPDRRNRYQLLQGFIDAIDGSAGDPNRPKVYSRRVIVIRSGETPLTCTASFSDNTDRRPAALTRNNRPSLQGYITAPQGSWFETWVAGRVGQRLIFDYVCTPSVDYVIVP